MCHFDGQVIGGNKERRGPNFARDEIALREMDNHLNESSANFEDILFLQLSLDDSFEVMVEVVKDTVEIGLVLH